jgi:hypothetical protein
MDRLFPSLLCVKPSSGVQGSQDSEFLMNTPPSVDPGGGGRAL